MKRAFDLTVGLLLMIALSPVVLTVAVVVRLFLGTPIIFRQVRPGLHEHPFVMLKFRTMTDARSASGNLLPDEVRLTRLGSFLRSSSLDELPELWNVVRGEMSLVGPRPLLMEYLPLYSGAQRKRHAVRPGLTGWAQVNGRNALTWPEKFALDLWYVENQSLWLDLRILALTVREIVAPRGGVCTRTRDNAKVRR